MKDKFKQAYMDVAERFAQLSHAQRAKVGAIIVKDDRIISIGYMVCPLVGTMYVNMIYIIMN